MNDIIHKAQPTDIHAGASIDQIADVICAIEGELSAAKERVRQMNECLADVVRERGRLRIGDMLYFFGREKKVKCKDVALTAQVMVENYSMEDLKGCLAANAWKHGACKQVMATTDYAACFTEWEDETLEKKLIKINTQFLPWKGGEPTSTETD